MQSMAAVSQLRGLPSLGTQSSGLFGDVKTSNLSFSSPRTEVFPTRNTIVRANFSGFNGTNAPVPSRGNEPSMFQNAPIPPSPPPQSPPQGGNTFTNDLNRPSPPPPPPPPVAAPSPGLSGGLGLNFPGNQIPGLPGSPRPKPGTPRPYDPTKQKSKVMEWLTPPPPPKELLQREHFRLSSTCNCTIYFGDMSKWFVDGKSDAVIAPANKRLNTGPAVNAVLFKAAGSRLLDATQRLPDIAPQGIKAEVGDAISTRAFNLPVSRVIHTVGPVYKKNDQTNVRESDESLIKAYKSALGIARKENLVYLAFPPLSCRIYGYPYSEGAEVALKTLKENCEGFSQIDIVIRNIEGYEAFIDEANKLLEAIKEKKVIKLPARNTGVSEPAAAAPVETPEAAATATAEGFPPVDIPLRPPTPPEAIPVPSLEKEAAAPPPPPPPVAPAPVPPVQSSTIPRPPPPPYDPGFPSPAGSTPTGFSQAPPPPGPQFQSPYSANYNQGVPQYSNAQANFQPAPPPPRSPFQSSPNQFQAGPPQFQGFQPPYQQQQQPGAPPPPYQQQQQQPGAPPSPYQQQQQPGAPTPPPSSPGFQQYNQPPPHQMSPYSAQYQGNAPPAPTPPPPPPFQQTAPQFQESSTNYPQYPPASPPPPPPPPPAALSTPATAGAEQEASRLPPHQQKYVPPPPPPPPESKPIPPSERVSPFPPPNRPPRQPSSPTSTYEQPLF